jgi:hypothetical protein
MTSLLLVLMFGGLALVLLDGNWRGGLLATVLIGFLQDPLRKITPGQPSIMVGLVLIAFVLTLMVMYEKTNGNINLRAMFWTVPQIQEWIPIYFLLIAVQSLNSLMRFGNLELMGLGAAFYMAPAIGLWAGFLVGSDPKTLKKIIKIYLVMASIYAVSAWLSFRGMENPLLSEVGEGIKITFEGFSAQGISGLWRTSEIAAWHFAAAACFSLTLAVSADKKSANQLGLIVLAAAFTYLTIPTGRRKAVVLVLVFTAIYLLLFSRKASAASRERVISSVLGGAAMAYGGYALFLISSKGDSFDRYLNRVATAKDALLERFQGQGIGAFQRALEVSQGLGLGVGAGANLGNLKLDIYQRNSIQGLSYSVEGGGGRIAAELGLPGLIIGGIIVVMILLSIRRNFRLLPWLEPEISFLLLGLVSFSMANVLFFFSAAQVYSDPFILILLSLGFGAFLAIPTLVSRQQAQSQLLEQQRLQLLEQQRLQRVTQGPSELGP